VNKVIIFAVCLALASGLAAADTYLNIEYARAGDTSLYLDLYVPSGPGPHPVVVSVHGGSWTTGDRQQGLLNVVSQLDRGYAIANIDYRLAPGAIYPAQIHDCKAAVRWVRANSGAYNLDPGAIGVIGFSAGGHLSAILGTSYGVEELEGDLGNPGYSSRVQAVVDYFGPSDLLKIEEQAPSCLPGDPNDPNEPPSLLLGCTLPDCPDKAAAANPITYVTEDDPPFLLLHGTSDCLVPWQQSQILHNALRDAGVDSTFILVPFATHADPLFLVPPVQNEVNDFLDEHLKKQRPRRRGVRR
jgi:acetyl esterase/lipase